MILKLGWRLICHKPLQSIFLVVLMALSVALSVLVFSLGQGIHQGLVRATEPFSLLVGAKGSSNQLVLNSVFLQDQPIGNIPYTEVDKLRANTKMVKAAVPLAFGDNYAGYRIVGTESAIFDVKVSQTMPEWLRVVEGRKFEKPFEVVIGRDVAKQANLQIGSKFHSIHGVSAKGKAHDHQDYTVVGILDDVGGPYNQAILTDIESIWLAHETAHTKSTKETVTGVDKPVENVASKTEPARLEVAEDDDDHDHDGHDHDATNAGTGNTNVGNTTVAESTVQQATAVQGNAQVVPSNPKTLGRAVTAVMVEPVGYAQAMQLMMQFQRSKEAQLVFPAQVIVQLFAMMGQGEKMWLPVGGLLILISLLVMMTSSYLSSLGRLREQAIMVAMGASKSFLMKVSICSQAYLVVGGAFIGWAIGAACYAGIASMLQHSMAISMGSVWQWQPAVIAAVAAVIGLLASIVPAVLLQRKSLAQYF